jgi:hypothetical protein
MARRVFRILLILVLAALAGVTGWQAWSLDRTRTQQRDAAALLQRDALRVTQAILDLRASQRAYLSPGQGIAPWKSRVDAHINTLREHFHGLREQASASTSPFAAAAAQADDEAMDSLIALKYLEQRIADHVEAGRIQHAADLVYADGVRISLALERNANAAFTAHEQDLQAGRTRIQWTEGALLALAAAIGFVLAWLVMPARRTETEAGEATAAAEPAAARATGKSGRRSEPAVQGLGLASDGRAAAGAGATANRGSSVATAGGRTTPASAAATAMDDLPLHAPAAAFASGGAGSAGRQTQPLAGTARTGTGTPAATIAASAAGSVAAGTPGAGSAAALAVAPESASGAGAAGRSAGSTESASSTPVSSMAIRTQEGLLAAAAELTVSVARVGDVDGLQPVLARLAEHLDAVGVIVWLEDASSQRLTPIITHGYPAETLAHLPPIDLDADNATARAWRLAELQIVAGRGNQPGAIVVPMPSSAGCVGVVSAEVRHGREHDPATLALARILAAQLAMLTGARG